MNTNSVAPYQFKSPAFRKLGYLVWLILGILSIVFYKERATFMDGGFQLTELINNGTFQIYHYRLTNPLTQILALAAIKLSLPLKVVMIAYSLNFILLFAFIYHLIVKWCKNDFLGWTQIAFFTFLATDSFFFLTPEFYQGMSLLLLWFAMILRFDFQQKWLLPVLTLLLIPIIFDHLLLTAFFIFLWCFFWLHEPKLRRWQYWFFAFALVVIYVVHHEFFTSWYDIMKTESFKANFREYFPAFHEIPAHAIFLKKFLGIYSLLFMSSVCIAAYYLGQTYSKEGKGTLNLGEKHQTSARIIERFFPLIKFFLVFGFCLAYLLIIHIGDPTTPYIFYAEVNYLGLAIPISVALLFDVAPKIKHEKTVLVIVGLLCVIRILLIINTAGKFTDRHEWMLSKFEKNKTNRLIIKAEDTSPKFYIQDWSIPNESLLITALEGPKAAKSLLVATDEKQYKDYLEEETLLLESMRQTDVGGLNKTYFDMGEGRYTVYEK